MKDRKEEEAYKASEKEPVQWIFLVNVRQQSLVQRDRRPNLLDSKSTEHVYYNVQERMDGLKVQDGRLQQTYYNLMC